MTRLSAYARPGSDVRPFHQLAKAGKYLGLSSRFDTPGAVPLEWSHAEAYLHEMGHAMMEGVFDSVRVERILLHDEWKDERELYACAIETVAARLLQLDLDAEQLFSSTVECCLDSYLLDGVVTIEAEEVWEAALSDPGVRAMGRALASAIRKVPL